MDDTELDLDEVELDLMGATTTMEDGRIEEEGVATAEETFIEEDDEEIMVDLMEEMTELDEGERAFALAKLLTDATAEEIDVLLCEENVETMLEVKGAE